jgi:DNA polymerase elongation subunit (family B)
MKNLQLVNVIYFQQRKGFDDKIMVVFKDEEDKKYFEIVNDPVITYYTTKPEFKIKEIKEDLLDENGKPVLDENGKKVKIDKTQYVNYIEYDKVDEVSSYYRDLFQDLADFRGPEWVQFRKECLVGGRFYYMNKLHLDANIHGSDIDISDYYIGEFLDLHPMEKSKNKINKAFFDIEVDISRYSGFPDEHEAPCPINIITLFNQANMTCYTYILMDETNPLIYELEIEKLEYQKFLREYMKLNYNIEATFKLEFFNSEIDLIRAFFQNINKINKPDFLSAWNLKFDALTIINRIKNLGFQPEDIMCPKEMPYKNVFFKEDFRNQDHADKTDYLSCSSYTIYTDLLLLYASIRKTMGKKESYALDAIAESELGFKKLEMDSDENLRNLPKKDFKKFTLYNVVDVVLLHLLEKKNEDIDLVYSIANMTRTRFNKALAKTVCLKNLARKVYFDQNLILSNNRNVTYGGDRQKSEKFKGAFVASPELMDNTGIFINGNQSRSIFDDVIDFDLEALYPSIILALNIDKSTQHGQVIYKVKNENGEEEDLSDRLFDSLGSRDFITFGKKYLGLPSIKEMIDIIKKEIS